MSTSSARPDDLDAFATGSRAADDELRELGNRLGPHYNAFLSGTSWGYFDIQSLLGGFGEYIGWNETDARWVTQIAAAFRAAGGSGGLATLPDAAIEASLRSAGLDGDRGSVTFDDPVAFGFPPTTGYANDPVSTAVLAELVATSAMRRASTRPGASAAPRSRGRPAAWPLAARPWPHVPRAGQPRLRAPARQPALRPRRPAARLGRRAIGALR